MKDKLDLCIDQVHHLPPTPTLLLELLALFKQPDRDIDQVVKVISHDPSLTAEVLRRCNSAYFSGSQPAADMFEAVLRLGFYEMYRIVVVLFGSRAMSIPNGACGIQVEALWRHSVTTAVAAGVLAEHLQEPEGVAFTAGLLHDVGKVVLALPMEPDTRGWWRRQVHAGRLCWRLKKRALALITARSARGC